MVLTTNNHMQMWFGGVAVDAVDTSVEAARLLNPMEARFYRLEVTAGPTVLGAVLPYDVRNWRVGVMYFHIAVASASTKSVVLVDFSLTPVTGGTIAAGQDGQVWLSDNSTALGTWLVRVETGGARARK